MADKGPQAPWDYLIKNSGGETTTETYNEYEKALEDGDFEKAQELYDRACRDAS
ncbi:hypothetical protein [Catenulispora yoronensis]|uniref:hypothetical protein n=1 Tax=Catenulispora yoronensis TaxID=450799 RepID=UPI0031E3E7BA